MRIRRTTWLLGALVLLAPAVARAAAQLEGFYGIERPPSQDFSSAVSGAVNSPRLFDTSLELAGGDLLLSLGALEVGAIGDVTFGHHTASQSAIGGLLGFGVPLGPAKLDLLGELGGHRYGNFTEHPEIVTSSSSNEWLLYVGLRPGFSVRIVGPLSIGVWTFVRWDLQRRTVPVTVGNATTEGSYKLGGTTIGATFRLGLEL